MQQTFLAGNQPRVIIAQVRGDLKVSAWDQPTIDVGADDHVAELHQEGDTVMIIECSGDLELHAPANTEIKVTNLKGDVSIEGVRRVELEDIGGDVELENIGIGADIEQIGEAIALSSLRADVHVTNASSLRARHKIGGDASLSNVALVEIEAVDADLSLEHTETVAIGNVGGDLEVEDIADALSCGNVGGDCEVRNSARCEIALGNVGGEVEINSAASAKIGSVGGDCGLTNVQGIVEVGNVGGDANFVDIGGNLRVGSVGGDGELASLKGAVEIGNIGGDLELQATFPAGSHTRLNVGGDASIDLPRNPDLSIRASVGGEVTGESVSYSGGGNLVSLVYGNGAAELELRVGGDLELRGAGNPRSSSWGDFGGEMADFGRRMARLGQELSREIAMAFQEAGWSQGSEWAKELKRKMDEQARKMDEQARRAEEKARRAAEHASRVRVRVNDREWRLDPERLERIKEQARKAATEGIAGALEAVERAIDNLRVPTPPKPPVPPTPPSGMPPVPPTPTPPPPPGQTPRTGVEGATQSEQPVQQSSGGPASDIEQEREAVLRMIAEGRISPEEGDMLLEGLGG